MRAGSVDGVVRNPLGISSDGGFNYKEIRSYKSDDEVEGWDSDEDECQRIFGENCGEGGVSGGWRRRGT